jgi:hypothetical protein
MGTTYPKCHAPPSPGLGFRANQKSVGKGGRIMGSKTLQCHDFFFLASRILRTLLNTTGSAHRYLISIALSSHSTWQLQSSYFCLRILLFVWQNELSGFGWAILRYPNDPKCCPPPPPPTLPAISPPAVGTPGPRSATPTPWCRRRLVRAPGPPNPSKISNLNINTIYIS